MAGTIPLTDMITTSWRIECLARAVAVLLAAVPVVATAQLAFDGSEYQPNGKLLGDQSRPAIAIGSSRSVMAWQENTDSDGLAIKVRLLGGQFSGIAAPVYANTTVVGDQENPHCLALGSGDFFVTWQSGSRGSQRIIGRFLNRDGAFATGEIELSEGVGSRNPRAIQSANGTITVVWTQNGVDADMEAVVARQLTPTGVTVGAPVRLNVSEEFNQRDPAAANLADGTIFVAWVAESPNGSQPSTIVGRRFSGALAGITDEVVLTPGKNPCAQPAVVTTSGGLLVVWNEYQLDSADAGWDIMAKPITPSGGSLGLAKRATVRQTGDQGEHSLAAGSGRIMLAFISQGIDGSGLGIGLQQLLEDGSPKDADVVANTTSLNNQLQPTIGTDAAGSALIAWVGFGSANSGVDLFAQRVTKNVGALATPNAPSAVALSSSKIRVVCTETEGLPVAKYLIYVDGSPTPTESTSPYVTVSGLAPTSEHRFAVALQMLDGRISSQSDSSSAVTWSEDENADGLPDSWQAKYFGSTEQLWPLPWDDSDGDGKSNRDEFLAGTNPSDASSVLKISLIETGAGTVVTWNSLPGGIYQVQFSSDLLVWNDLGKIHLASGQTESLSVGDAPANSYYRVNCLR